MPDLRKKAAALPLKPGVYIMYDAEHAVIYVGKAKALRNRVSSYFQGEHNAKTEAMVSKIADFDVIIAASEFEALVLENDLIKHHMPQYNILLKDDKGYPFVRLDKKNLYPRFTIASEPEEDGAEYFGPFSSRGTVNAAIDAVSKAVRLPTCSRRFPRDIGKARPCLNYHMGSCPGYCLAETPREMYLEAVEQARQIFSGHTGELVRDLRLQMETAAEQLDFESAASLRDRMKAVSALQSRQYVFTSASVDLDAVGFAREGSRSCFVVLHYIEGKLLDKDYQLMEEPMEEDAEVVPGLTRQYYALRGRAPKQICMMRDLPDLELLGRFLTERTGKKVSVTAPLRGDKLRYVEAACLNAREEIKRAMSREEKTAGTALWLQKTLSLDRPPRRIEAFDVSNMAGQDIVASMIVFVEGKPKKRDYRKFKIDLPEQDDFASMADAVRRRFSEYEAGNEKFSELPDLLLIDGGEGQVRSALSAMGPYRDAVPVYGMVKDDRHRTRALVSESGEEVSLTNPAVFAFIGTIQEETHRFAIAYQRTLRSRRTAVSTLDRIPGIGESRKTALLRRYRSIRAVSEASEEDLRQILPAPAARAVWEHFHEKEGNGTLCE